MDTNRVLFVAKPYVQGNSVVVVLERELREALGWRPGDIILIRLHKPYATLRRGVPELAIPMADIHLEDLPPAWPYRSKNAVRQTDKT